MSGARLTHTQTDFLLRPINTGRVQHLRGMSHLEAWDVRRHLIRVFGIEGFTIETIALDLVSERESRQGQRSRWTVVYRAQVRLTVRTPSGAVASSWEDAAAGDSVNQPSLGDAHDMAMKTALSQALKRCAVNLGDQFGLSLYNAGSPAAVVIRSLAYADEPVKDDAPVRPEPLPAVPSAAPDQPVRDFVTEAHESGDADEVRHIWQEAKEAGLPEKDLGRIASVGKTLLAEPTEGPASGDGAVAAAAAAPSTNVVRQAVDDEGEVPVAS